MPRWRIVLVNLPNPPGMVVNREGVCGLGNTYPGNQGFLYPPHTLAAVAGQLRRLGHRVRVIDAVAEGWGNARVVREIQGMEPRVIGIHLSHATLSWDIGATNFIKQKLPRATTVVFGPIMQFEARLVGSRTLADAILVGEPEFLFPKVLSSLVDGFGFGPPAVYHAAKEFGSGAFPDGFSDKLEWLAPPAWDICRIRDGRMSLMASRGCDDGCAYCPYVLAQGNRFRTRLAEDVGEELDWVVKKCGARKVIFRDPVFAADRQRVVSLCEIILKRKLQFAWECESRPEHFDPGLLGLLKRAGCEEVKVGLETVDGSLLARLGRLGSNRETPAYLESFLHLAEACRIVGLRLRIFVMEDLPGQSQGMVDKTKAFVEGLNSIYVNVKSFERYPGLRLSALSPVPVAEELVQPNFHIAGGSLRSRGEATGGSDFHVVMQ